MLHRSHAGVEDRVRTNKAMELDNLSSASWEVNRGWMLAANLASDLDAWVRLLALHDIEGLAHAEPDTMRFRFYHLPARLADHAAADGCASTRLAALGPVQPGAPAASRDDLP